MKVLVLGGISESRRLTEALIAGKFAPVYSIAGLVRRPQLDCEVRVGGFSDGDMDGIEGMCRFVRDNGVERLVDATHPYAARISFNAAKAADRAGVSCWRYLRPGWGEELRGARWFDDWDDLAPMLEEPQRPFFTLGRSVLDNVDRRLPGQHWIVRTAASVEAVDGATVIHGIGPFDYGHEHALMREHGVDALITKNSGTPHGAAKLHAARDLGVPVFVQRRPELVPVERSFDRIEDMLRAFGLPEG